MAKLNILDIKGKETGQMDVPDQIFSDAINAKVIHQAVVMYQASLRQGNASTKERGSVKGSGKKPYRQKGSGRARVGSARNPLWKGGGIVFGPHPRDFSYQVPRKIRKLALKESLNAKYKDNDLCCIDDIKDAFEKTKEFVKVVENLKLNGKILALLDGSDESVMRVTRNIPRLDIMRAMDVTAYDILRHKKLLVTKTALDCLFQRIQK